MNWFTADWHLFHYLKNRPFKNVDQMNAHLVSNYNERVTNADTCYFLGDVLGTNQKAKDDVIELLENLNGKKILVVGNHDDLIRDWIGWDLVVDYLEIEINRKLIVLCHYPFERWKNAYLQSFHFHGHTHGKIHPLKNRVDVGVDCHNYAPVSFEDITESLCYNN